MADESSRIAARFDGWVLLREPLELTRDGARVRLQELPLQILEVLASRHGQLVTREELIAHLWPKGVVDFDAGLNTAMRKLRATLGDDAESPKYIETVPRQGYRFIAEAGDDEQRATLPIARPRKGQWIPAAIVVLAALMVGWWIYSSRDAAAPSTVATSKVRLGILPFENLSPNPANAFFTDGMHEEVVSTLANVPNLEVISRTTMMQYRKMPRAVSEVARELGVTHVLEGTVRREGDVVRVTLQLIDAADDRHLWSRTFDRELVNIMTLQSQVAAEVAAQLTSSLARGGGRLPPPRNPDAYDLWLQGVLAWQNVGGGGVTAQEIQRVEGLYTRAIELDDRYAAAYADRCRVRIVKFVNGSDQSEANIAGARSDLAMAQELAASTPHVLMRRAGLAYLVDGDMRTALDLIDAAEKIGPLNADFLLTKGNFLAYAGRFEDSLATHERAAQLDPGNPSIVRFRMVSLFAAHRPADALRVAQAFDQRIPGRIDRGELLFQYTGSTVRWRKEVDRLRPGIDATGALSVEFELLRNERRFAELNALLARPGLADFRQHSAYGNLIGSGPKPIAQLHGWERLLAGDRTGAARNGRLVLAYAERQPPKSWNGWSLHLLTAEGALLVGDHSRAQSEARLALAAIGSTPSFAVASYTRSMAARVFAWSGAHEDAVKLLEQLTREYPGIGPAAVTRDPSFSMPLETNAQYRELAKKLEAEILANQNLL